MGGLNEHASEVAIDEDSLPEPYLIADTAPLYIWETTDMNWPSPNLYLDYMIYFER